MAKVQEPTFPFFELAPLVQRKILRQYVPIVDKITTLSSMKEFSSMLNQRSFWLNNNLFDFLPVIRNLSPGFYVRKNEKMPMYGCYVSMEDVICITFTFCLIFPPNYAFIDEYFNDHPSKQRIKVKTNIVEKDLVKEFFQFFSNFYCLERCKPFAACFDENFTFLCDVNEQYGKFSELNFYPKILDFYDFTLFRKNENIYVHSFDNIETNTLNKIKLFPLMKLESLVLNQETKQPHEFRIIHQCNFSFLKDGIKADCKLYNTRFFHRYFDRYCRFSFQDIMKNTSFDFACGDSCVV